MARWLPLALLLSAPALWAQTPAELERGFANPPPSARPQTWWHWVDGNVSKEGLTLDLEAMARVGIGGVEIFNVGCGLPPGPVRFLSDDWRQLIQHAIREADRLGLDVCLHNTAGWSSSGGPWIKPEQAMQMVVTSEVRVEGPNTPEARTGGGVSGPGPDASGAAAGIRPLLPQPPTRKDYYRDIAVLAFPTPPAEAETMADLKPQVTCSITGLDAARVADGRLDTSASLSASQTRPQTIDFIFPRPFTVRTLWMDARGGRTPVRVELQASDDGATFRKLVEVRVGEQSLLRPPITASFAAATAKRFRLQLASLGGSASGLSIAEVRLEPGVRLANIGGKAGYDRSGPAEPGTGEAPADAIIRRDSIINLTDKLQADGRLDWQAPPGHWTILRLGATLTGKDNHPAPVEGRGLECDKLSAEAADAAFAGMMGKVISDAGPLAGKALNQSLIDSYEVDCQNWTPRMREDFQARRGYDLTPLLPVLTGRVVDSVSTSERFLWDYRRTIGDLYADNYFGRFADLCHRYGLKLGAEPYGNGNFDDMACGDHADIAMSEFWMGQGRDVTNAKLASSVAHTNGRQFVGAEAFTASADAGRWLNHPALMKPLGDLMECGGVNRFIFHCYAQQPWRDLAPGMTMGPWGTRFSRTNTWWEQSVGWMSYLARCQTMLQSGLFAADLCYCVGENAPNGSPGRGSLNPSPPAGYDYDTCSAAVVLQRMSVRDGRIVLPDGMSYRVLVLPPRQMMTPELLRKVAALVKAGATVIGPKPAASPSLRDQPNADAEVQKVADELWGKCDGKTVTENAVSAGKIVWGRPLADVFAEMKLPPDAEFAPGQDIVTIHRRIGDAEVYFVSSQSTRPQTVAATFRVEGKAPELWHPDTGKTEPAPLWRKLPGRTQVTLRLDPVESVFVIFRQSAPQRDTLVSFEQSGRGAAGGGGDPARPPHRLEITRATYGVLTADIPDCVDVTEHVRALVRNGGLSVAATNALAGDPAQNVVKQLRVDYVYNGTPGRRIVEENQTLKLPEQPAAQPGTLEIRKAIYGLLPPDGPEPKTLTVDVTQQLVALVKDGRLSVVAGNQLAGDPASMILKQLCVEYTVDGKPHRRTIGENQTLELPDSRDLPDEPPGPPAPELAAQADGSVAMTAWENGRYAGTTAGGKHLAADVTALPAPQIVPGPWEVRFPPKLGAPERITLSKLISWTDSDDAGVKHFSGTATYVGTLNVPAGYKPPPYRLMLDLGIVKEIARVSLNGKDVGLLWKPPFRVDITGLAKPGVNRLEVQVTNLWVNRLIGDEQLPPEAEYSPGGPIKAWPDWVYGKGKRPATGRIGFPTWNHWTKDAPLLESGLIGPVTLRVGRTVQLDVPKD